MTVATAQFAVMGSTAMVALDGPAALLRVARQRLEDLEHKWSRFRRDSEVSRLNRARHPLRVSADTRRLLACAAAAWHHTEGVFDPTVHDALLAWGYDRDLGTIDLPPAPTRLTPAPGLASVVVDDHAGTADLGGVSFDPGGIGKGLAADIVATELVGAGAAASLVDVGGDLRVAGEPPGQGWPIGVEDPLEPARDLVRMHLRGGGVATSSNRRRRWRNATGAEVHHLVAPSTGAPASVALAGVSVLAGEAWWAEALTKAVLVGGFDAQRLAAAGASAIGRARGGGLVGTPDLLELARAAA
ncbi:MAG TPA: FAD:protein FMN transferase [Acidimicrobiales bacterium]|nr:FAD:protein FMN transferase [Acidimicrobiales bacterium]